mmetsp:Transcript_27049/g.67626  ORF Transcript_27049/g.67626 Transcript_27049/m.67626 type:complete len:213 (+) Transcript_27049:288-926(+)
MRLSRRHNDDSAGGGHHAVQLARVAGRENAQCGGDRAVEKGQRVPLRVRHRNLDVRRRRVEKLGSHPRSIWRCIERCEPSSGCFHPSGRVRVRGGDCVYDLLEPPALATAEVHYQRQVRSGKSAEAPVALLLSLLLQRPVQLRLCFHCLGLALVGGEAALPRRKLLVLPRWRWLWRWLWLRLWLSLHLGLQNRIDGVVCEGVVGGTVVVIRR